MTEVNNKFNVGDTVLILRNCDGAEHRDGDVGIIDDFDIYVSGDYVEISYCVDVDGWEWWHQEENLVKFRGQSVGTLLDDLKEIREFGAKNCGHGFSCSEIAKKALKDWGVLYE